MTAIGSRSIDKAQAFAENAGLSDVTCHGSYEALIADPQVDAIYIATPHPMHAQWAIRAAEAGKHILCEKPATLNHAEASAVIEAAKTHDVFFMEAFKDRCHPQTQKLLELIRSGAVGQVRMLRVDFGFNADMWNGFDPESRLFNAELGGGGILDVGCYAIEMARLVAGAGSDKPFLDPIAVKAAGHVGETGVDEWTAALLQFENDVVAIVSTGVRAQTENSFYLMGSAGRIIIPDPWLNGREGPQEGLVILENGDGKQEIKVPSEHSGFGYEVSVATRAILERKTQADSPAMTWDDTLGQMKTLDAWRKEIGLIYPGEA